MQGPGPNGNSSRVSRFNAVSYDRRRGAATARPQRTVRWVARLISELALTLSLPKHVCDFLYTFNVAR
eukprot:6201547-Pleurochrysis_carterae.AAC.3